MIEMPALYSARYGRFTLFNGQATEFNLSEAEQKRGEITPATFWKYCRENRINPQIQFYDGSGLKEILEIKEKRRDLLRTLQGAN